MGILLIRIVVDSFGDGEFKPLGVTAEPEVKHRIIDGKSAYDVA